jgi:hypothetical protein
MESGSLDSSDSKFGQVRGDKRRDDIMVTEGIGHLCHGVYKPHAAPMPLNRASAPRRNNNY